MIRKVTAVMLVILLFMRISDSAYAMNFDLSDAVIDVDGEGIIIDHASDDEPDRFVAKDKVEPGDIIRRAYVITNTYSDGYRLYLKAENPVSTPAHLDFVNKIYLKLTLDGELIYNGTVGGGVDENGVTMENNIELGFIEPESSHRLEAVFEVDGPQVTNEYMRAKASVDWIFQAIRTDSPVDPPDTRKPDVDTGDTSRINWYLIIFIASGLILQVAHKYSKDKKV